MTPAQLDHLRRIDAHLANLLSTAEKRTGGDWGYYWGWDMVYSDSSGQRKMIADCVDRKEPTEQVRDDMAFIASCAGNAEAGWRATRLAIKTLLEYTGPLTPQIEREYAKEKLGEIIALFPNV